MEQGSYLDKAKPEFTRRAAFALLWSLSVHEKSAPDSDFEDHLSTNESAAHDERKFVKKAFNMALRAIGKRSPGLNAAAVETAESLSQSKEPAAKWVGSHALRELTSVAVRQRLRMN